MSIQVVNIPTDVKKLERDIIALKWQIQNETDKKSKLIFAETLKLYELNLQKIKSKSSN